MYLELRSDDPVDIFLLEHEGKLVAFVINSTGGYTQVFDKQVPAGLSLRCSKHRFSHPHLQIVIVDDFALIDGCACFHEELGEKQRRLFDVLCGN